MPPRRPQTADDHVAGVLSGDRAALGRALTLVESRAPRHHAMAQEVITRLLPHSGTARRVGISGVPGVGKSTFIETFGTMLTGRGHKVAVLAVDPTSSRSGGSILGDKTRMNRLAVDDNAFIRPSPTSGHLGGVTRMTRESMIIVEAAGYDVVLVETVGTGQSEIMVADMVDFFLVLMLPGAGDELQGIKRGILEIADLVAVNKVDQAPDAARLATRDYAQALHIMTPTSATWHPPVLTCSGHSGKGLDELWQKIEEHRIKLTETGELDEKRRGQRIRWMWAVAENRLVDAFTSHPAVADLIPEMQRTVADATLSPSLAAERLLHAFGIEGLGEE